MYGTLHNISLKASLKAEEIEYNNLYINQYFVSKYIFKLIGGMD